MIGYAAKKPKWRAKESAVAEARWSDSYEGIVERAHDYLKACKPKKL